MLGNSKARNMGKLIATPFAKIFIKLGFSPDLVTLIGTLGVVVSSIIFFSQGQFLVGSIFFAMFVGLDAVDGTVARLLNRNSKWGAFFDSVLDRIADGVVLGSLAFYFANAGEETYFILSLIALLASEIVSYTKARAEGLGLNCDTGLAESPRKSNDHHCRNISNRIRNKPSLRYFHLVINNREHNYSDSKNEFCLKTNKKFLNDYPGRHQLSNWLGSN